MESYFDLGSHARPITTVSEEAQLWFDRGLNWLYGFNHAESVQAGLRLRRSAWRTACLAVYRACQPLACGCSWRELPVGTRARCGEALVGGLA